MLYWREQVKTNYNEDALVMVSERSIRRQIGAHSMFERAQVLDANDVKGRFEERERSNLVGAGAAYPKSSGPWDDVTARVLNSAPDPIGVDTLAAPIVGSVQEQAKAEEILSERQLRREIAQLSLEQKLMDAADPRVQEFQVRIDAAMAELDRRR
jgi:hypothetical protein